MALDVFIGEKVEWSWGEDRYGRLGPKFRLKTNSAGLTTEDTGGTERGWPNIESMEWIRYGSRTARRAIPTWGFAGRRAAGRAEPGGDAAGVEGVELRVAFDPSRFALGLVPLPF